MPNSPSSSQDPPPPPSDGPIPTLASSRRLPPPCWSHDETVALIDAYRDKWYSLRRGNLRAPHWQEVADAVASCCPIAQPKTAVQCRHKMEKLRKRYRSELQRAVSTPNGHRYCSSWVHFKRMDSMEKGPTASAVPIDRYDNEDVEEDQDDAEDFYQSSAKRARVYSGKTFHGSMSNGIGGGSPGRSGFRIKIPGRSSTGLPVSKLYRKCDDFDGYNPNADPNYGSTKIVKDGYAGKFGLGNKRAGDPLDEMVSAIKALGDGFVRMEKQKMEMAREVEERRMEMELKRTEMIIESQQQIVAAFAKGFSERKIKKVNRIPSPES